MRLIEILCSSFVASFGFGILFNIKGKKLILAGIGGSIGGVIYQVILQYTQSNMTAMFWAAVAFSLYSELCARLCKSPVTTFIICALIPLVPGGGMYRMMLQAIQGNINQALSISLETLSAAGILAVGILLVSTIVRGICKPRHRLKKEE